ncbi:MAG TPA: GvpL/GvpF family gas vesicle protein [Jatrophihabitantaceae bacterium]|jgi:hypothetical protein
MTTSVDRMSYVFGVVAAGTRLPEIDEAGPAAALRLVEAAGLAAVVGTPPAHRSLGRAADLLTHDRVVAALVEAGTPVLPMRFGAVLQSDAAVIEDVLTARHDELRAGLARVAGRVQFTLTVRYEQQVVLRGLLAARPDIARLRGSQDAENFDQRLRLGELVVQALDEMRPADAQAVLADLPDTADLLLHKTTAPDAVLHAAVLVERQAAAAFERGVELVARRHHPRLQLRLAGPSAPYDFVGAG